MRTYSSINITDLKPAYDDFYGIFNRRILLQDDVIKYRNETKKDILPRWDRFGYEIAYLVATVEQHSKWVYEDDDSVTEYVTIEIDDQGEPFVRELTGDVLCGYCAGFARDEAYYVAYQINGEVGDEETVHCSDCGEVIYKSWKDQEAERIAKENEDDRDEWLVGEER